MEWDGFSEPALPQHANILNKLKKERGQNNLDQFMHTFMQSIEQKTDVGEDIGGQGGQDSCHRPPGKSLVFGDLFELRKPPNGKEALNYHRHPVRGPSKCLVYIGELKDPSILNSFQLIPPFQLPRYYASRQC